MSSPSSLNCTKLSLCTLAAIFLQILGLSLFIFGFFPVKPTLSGVSGLESYRAPKCNSIQNHKENSTVSPHQLRSLYKEMSEIPATYDQLIIMVVDGLPAEFVLGKDGQPPTKAMMEAMPYTQFLLSSGAALGYHAIAAPPTVTMPRLKAMVSGAIGGFLDVAFNFNTQALLDDNLLDQFYSIGWNMVIHGDETWIKLFPGLFTRHDGVSSFFVKDTVQVDYNVSRHLEAELMSDDWHLLILHYLGLDHVGHIGGRNCVLMLPKLKEMDEVIKQIHEKKVLNHSHHSGQTLLVVLSDHGMTDSGNHGGSSFEETDSLALFIGLGAKDRDYTSATCNEAFQVNIAPTLALLFGVPIPKNNVGVLMSETFSSLSEDQQLRALELNSWQLLRLLRAQLPGLLCSCGDYNYAPSSESEKCKASIEHTLCCLFSKATALHSAWKSKEGQSVRSNSSNEFNDTVAAYNEFLKNASEWLSRTATDKPLNILVIGVAALLISCAMFLSIQFFLCKMVHIQQLQRFSVLDKYSYKWELDDSFLVFMVLVFVSSMGSSSMVEEEQYTVHFMTTTLYLLFLRKSFQSSRKYSQPLSIVLVLTLGRILRGWHQGGVNWVHLPDIAKWLDKAGPHITKSIQIISGFLVIILSFFTLYVSRLKRTFLTVMVQVSLFGLGLLVMVHVVGYQEHTLVIQTVYTSLIMIAMIVAIGSPWVMPISRASLFLIGWTYITCWCLLQILLQKPTHAMPTVLLLLQIFASLFYFSVGNLCHKQWVEVTALYLLGLTGHFSLGNTNTLATIDVAGAFIGVSSYSTLFSGILMFVITYASPLLCLLSLTMYISMKNTSVSQDTNLGHDVQMMVGIPCVVPLTLNSIMLTSFTVVLLLMRNHLFVWSVFSPKYLYVIANTVCVYVGVFILAASVIYTCLVFSFRRDRACSMFN
ncbi:hypothetical protein ACHQM5_016248 [Ranunculus cassubicifolius]